MHFILDSRSNPMKDIFLFQQRKRLWNLDIPCAILYRGYSSSLILCVIFRLYLSSIDLCFWNLKRMYKIHQWSSSEPHKGQPHLLDTLFRYKEILRFFSYSRILVSPFKSMFNSENIDVIYLSTALENRMSPSTRVPIQEEAILSILLVHTELKNRNPFCEDNGIRS